jgi:pyridoxine 5-phosphate synthase
MNMRLSVNIDHIATLRQARKARDPDPVAAAVLVELAGAHGITVHLRGDRRHVQERDLYLLRETVRTRLNIEVALTPEAFKVMKEVKPDQVTLVPERPEELTTEGGLDLAGRRAETAEYIGLYREAGIGVSLFIDPDPGIVKLAVKLKPDTVELNTLDYGSRVPGTADFAQALKRVAEAARLAVRHRISAHAGHDITYQNAVQLATAVPEIAEASIGHAIVARAALVGMERAVREMLSLLDQGQRGAS